MGGFYKFLKKYHLEKWFQKENLIVLILVGILLIVIALPTKSTDSEADSEQISYEEKQNLLWESYSGGASQNSGVNLDYDDKNGANQYAEGRVLAAEDYVSVLEEKLAGILSQVRGVGNVSVMITLQESEELVVEKDIQDNSEQTIYETEGNASVPYVIKTILPKIEGVAVIAEGAGNGTVTKNITEIVQALFDIEVHKIKVVGQ